MRFIPFLCLLTLLLPEAISPASQAQGRPERSPLTRSVVLMEVTRKQYDYFQPWTRRMKTSLKVATVIAPSQILTSADEVFDRTLVRLQKGGRGKWWTGKVQWIDYHANLALVTAEDPAFFDGLQPLAWAEPSALQSDLQIVRWREGNLEIRKAEFNQSRVDTGELSFAPHVQLEVNSEIQGVGAGEPVVSPEGIIGIATGQAGNTCTVTPGSFIRPILDAQSKKAYPGLGFFEFYWQPSINPANLAFAKLQGDPRGVVVIDVPENDESGLKPWDVILQVEGFDIDVQGDYEDPDYGYLSLENLATRGKWAGDEVKLLVSRAGLEMPINYRLPKVDFSHTLVPDAVYDQEPEYLIVGGLVFQPLTDSFLKGWGADWKRRAPFRLTYYNQQSPTKERPALVILSQVLPDVYNLGYQEVRHLVLDRVNNRKISHLADLRRALAHPIDGTHVVQFVQSDSLRRLVLDAKTQDAATQRVLRRYGIPAESYLVPPPDDGSSVAVAE